ncbi:imidazole glycerol phosphate synthase subunit HisH [Kiritimatiellota bacterium B12222]|nr:imidazole glycerol phosphate synthase subunit HisH [Kiritimatiellota bacterium B12222]
MIGILDYGMGNLGSVQNACAALGFSARMLNAPSEMEEVSGVLMPGQGAFRDCMNHLQDQGWVEPLREWIKADKPFFGICMGLQVLFESSEESPGSEGLGVLPGRVKKFPGSEELKVPQMGWNRCAWTKEQRYFPSELTERHFYFVHSYYVPLVDEQWVAGTSTYGFEYVSAISMGNCHAVQFHPEKSQADGLKLLGHFAASVKQG